METCIRCQSPDKVSDLTIFLTKICLVLYIRTTARKWHTPDQAHLTTENYQTIWLVSCIDFPRLLMSSKTTIYYSEPRENITIFFAYFSLFFLKNNGSICHIFIPIVIISLKIQWKTNKISRGKHMTDYCLACSYSHEEKKINNIHKQNYRKKGDQLGQLLLTAIATANEWNV